MNKFGMPKTTPNIGKGFTEKDLEQQIEDDLIDLKLEMDTQDFGIKAVEEDKKRSEMRSKSSAKSKSVVKS